MLLNKTELAVLEGFVLDYNARLTGSFIAKSRKLNQKTVSNFLKRLEDQNFLKSITEGKNKLYFLNLKDRQMILNFILLVENARTICFYQKHPMVKEVIVRLLPEIKGISLVFGSYAKGTEKKESDLDIFVVGSADEKAIDEIADMYHLEVNAVQYSLAAFRKALKENDAVVKEIIKSHILIQNAQEFVSCVMGI